VEEFLANPEVGPAGFNSTGFVRFGQFVWHEIGITGVTKNVIFYLTGEESSQSGVGGRAVGKSRLFEEGELSSLGFDFYF
jgi:hypothetical protein